MSQTGITANSDILSNLTGPRLAMLEATDLARRYTVRTGLFGRGLEQLIARAENRIIERILISRLKFALRQAGSLEAAELRSCTYPKCVAAMKAAPLKHCQASFRAV